MQEMFGSWELVDRPEVLTAMQLEKESPRGQSAEPTTALPKSGAAAQTESMVRQARMMILHLLQQHNLLCTSNKDVKTEQAKAKQAREQL